MEKRRTRTTNSCDGCSLRRVRCHVQGSPPCVECRKRCVECTFLRIPCKRGPKGPQRSTYAKVSHYQNAISQRWCPAQNLLSLGHENQSGLVPLSLYLEYLDEFRECLACVWPILHVEDLKSRLVQNPLGDHGAWALAGAVCATTIAQLRLSRMRLAKVDPSTRDLGSLAGNFARDAQCMRDRYIDRETFSTESLLTAFFLCGYFTMTERTRTAIMNLHQAIAQLHIEGLHLTDTFNNMADEQRELMLRIYWHVFISEK